MIKSIFLSLIIGILGVTVYAQRPDTLVMNPRGFIEGLEPYLTTIKDKAIEESFSDFSDVMLSGAFTEEEMVRIHKLSNHMIEERLSSNPYFVNYIKGLVAVRKVPETERLFIEWHDVLDTLLSPLENRTVRDFSSFLQFSQRFFSTGLLRTAGTGWKVDGEAFSIQYTDQEPVVIFPEGNLIGSRKADTLQILETSGMFLPLEGKWIGQKGKVTWERAGLGSEVYVTFDTFSIDLRRSLFSIDSVWLTYPLFFGERPILGKFTDKVTVNAQATSYPRFTSADRSLIIDNFATNISYLGGFSMEGNTIYGYGDGKQKAQIQIFNNAQKLVFKGRSERFIIRREEQIVGQQVDMAFYFDQDSIYHPSVNIRYRVPEKKLELTRGDRGADQSPFYSSLHKVTLDANDLVAFVERDSVLVGLERRNMVRKTPLKLQSFQYFDLGEYQSYQGLLTANPIALLKRAVADYGDVINADLLAERLNERYTSETITKQLYELASDGYIIYDAEEEKVYVKEKTLHFADAVDDRVDYDNIDLVSSTSRINAVIDLQDKGIYISGVKDFELSPRQKVAILPQDTSQLVLLPGRDMDFGGTVMAGYSQIDGRSFHFDYDKFMLQLDSIDTWRMFIPQERPISNPNTDAFSLNSIIESFSGQLVIDAQTNKSGKQNIPLFPFLRSDSKSYVYYDSDFVKDTVYVRDSFYLTLEPFTFNRLDDYTEEDISFSSSLVSAGIFPDIQEEALVRKDYSLGFAHQSPEEGYPVFGGKGQYTGVIDLSNQGLKGIGQLKYLGAQIEAEDFIFRPLEVEASAKAFDLAEDRTGEIEVPQVHGDDVKITWKPYSDSMIVQSVGDTPFALFQTGDHNLQGELVLTPGGVQGAGVFDWPLAKMTSEGFSFGAFSAEADTTDIRIKALEEQNMVAIQTEDIKGRVDFDEEKGYFKGNQAFLTTDLPYNQYRTSMKEFV
ncbi:MAG: hypothetical protein HRU40_10910, partial [Saprospiraceae bacterium]|nr:hypothetical protein [Saprospiraceae bacterium]